MDCGCKLTAVGGGACEVIGAARPMAVKKEDAKLSAKIIEKILEFNFGSTFTFTFTHVDSDQHAPDHYC